MRREKYFSIIILIMLFILLFSTTTTFAKLDIGGEINMTLSGVLFRESETLAYPKGSLDLELYIPPFDDNQIKSAVYLYNNPTTGRLDFMFKKLYFRHKFEKLQLTAGRQPISWSFGSMLNPIDFTLGSMVMDEETGSKYQNAIEAYYPINWNSSITVITAFPNGFENMKWGLRGRTMLEGYDLTLNYVREAEQNNTEIMSPVSQRIGFSAKGDLGPFGIYGAIGYNFEDINSGDFSFLTGGDYSYYFESGSKIYFQLEYLSIKEERLSSLLGSLALLDSGLDSESNANLFLTRTSYDINEFSAISLFTITSLNDFSTIIMPNYSNQISNSLAFNCSFAYFSGKENTLFGPGLIGGIQEKPKMTIEAGFIYSF
ncbi:MAG TPA: hypothetical protein ENO17_05105 [Candidatus Atribacteria bacterium]|nr:hypothetical protein [Candidatus Atribacteria bacterium]